MKRDTYFRVIEFHLLVGVYILSAWAKKTPEPKGLYTKGVSSGAARSCSQQARQPPLSHEQQQLRAI